MFKVTLKLSNELYDVMFRCRLDQLARVEESNAHHHSTHENAAVVVVWKGD